MMESEFILLIGFILAAVDGLPLKNSPSIQFDIYNIKKPQLIGIIAGCCVFVITISVVIYLLYVSGTLGRAFAEIAADGVEINLTVDNKGSLAATVSSSKIVYDSQPLLYDNLVEARRKKPVSSKQFLSALEGKTILLCNYYSLNEKRKTDLFEAGNGTAQYHESAYDPMSRLWGWMDLSLPINDRESSFPYIDVDILQKLIEYKTENSNHVCLAIIDTEYDKPIGLVMLADVDVPNLSLRLDYIWVTPAFQGKRRAHEAIFVLLLELFAQGYRRITAECDERHAVARKFWQRCGFLQEAILRKRRIINDRNSNCALFVFLNSDWIEAELVFRKYIGWVKINNEDESK